MLNSMNTTKSQRVILAGFAAFSLALFACSHPVGAQKDDGPKKSGDNPQLKKVEVAKNVWLEIDGDKRRVVIAAVVCRRMDLLEQFLCKKQTKEHESILSADIDASKVHAALLLAGAEAGSPVKFAPKYQPAHGTVIKVYVQYEKKGETIKVPAQKWVKNVKTKKEMTHDWVFAGSVLFPNRLDPKAPPIYGANDGDVICLSNFETAMLDLPIVSSKDNDDLMFECNTDLIPPLDTAVLVILEPVVAPKKK